MGILNADIAAGAGIHLLLSGPHPWPPVLVLEPLCPAAGALHGRPRNRICSRARNEVLAYSSVIELYPHPIYATNQDFRAKTS